MGATLQKSDLVILSSDWEGFGIPIVEAAMNRRLVASHPYPVLKEFQDAGLTVLPLDADTVLSVSPDEKAQILERNFSIAQEKFSPERVSELLRSAVLQAL